jgi:hypothetical protein
VCAVFTPQTLAPFSGIITAQYEKPYAHYKMALFALLWYVLIYYAVVLSLRALIHLIRYIRPLQKALNLCVVLGSGGHTYEMSQILPHIKPSRFTRIVFFIADTDTGSEKAVKSVFGQIPPSTTIRFERIQRAREVG